MNERKLRLIAFVILIFPFFAWDIFGLDKGEAAGPWVSQENTATTKAQEFKDNLLKLKQKRDEEIAALIKERNAKIQALVDGERQTMQDMTARLAKDKEVLQQKVRSGADKTSAQTMLSQEKEAVKQKSQGVQQSVEQQINYIKATYDERIRNVARAYEGQFDIIKQMRPPGR